MRTKIRNDFSNNISKEVQQEFQRKPITKKHNDVFEIDANLTRREDEILQELVRGSSYKDIAAKYKIRFFTVNNHIRKIYEKLGVNSKGEAIAKVIAKISKKMEIAASNISNN